MMDFRKYNSFIFDCDGVILNSNEIKTNSFRKILRGYNQEAIDDFIEYHKNNGGVSRYIKLKNFLDKIIPKYCKTFKSGPNELNSLLNKFSLECTKSLSKAEVTKNLKEIREITKNSPWMIVSGGDQKELREVFKNKNIYGYFDGGIFGSPDKKIDIINREIINKNIVFPALYFGDSKLDHITAIYRQIDFIFVSKWTDFIDYETYCESNSIKTINSVFEFFVKSI